MRHQTEPRGVLVAIVALLALADPALGATAPWTVQRSLEASATESASPHAVVVQAPWDDAPGVLSDGNSYFYLVTDASGLRLSVSVDKNLLLDTVRLGFDDGDPTSAPVDPQTSSVTVAPASVPADGLSSAWVTIVPRDADGLPLGAGLTVSIDPVALWPGTLAGSLVDLGNGVYLGRVVSSVPGQGVVWVEVEGVSLAEEPTIDFESTGPLSLRDLAILQLDGLTSPGGTFDLLVGGLDPATDSGASEVVQAKADALSSLGTLLAGDPQSDDEAIKDQLKAAVIDLTDALDDFGAVDPASIEMLLEDLLDVARLVAQYWYDFAAAQCTQPWSRLDQAEQSLANGNASVASEDWVGAATHYGKSIEKSLLALQACG